MEHSATNPLKITEVVLRDAHQSLLATRMRTEHMLPIAEKLDQVGYFSMEMWGGATFDSCLRFLNEDPWERSKQLKKLMPKTPFQMLLRGQNLVGYRHYADDVVERFVKKSVDVGIDIFRIFDALNDFRNIKTALDTVKKCGKIVEAAISYTVSPVHSTELYIKMAHQLEDMGADIICIKDMAGLLTPGITRILVREIKKEVKLPIHLHTHATTGLVGMNLQCAIDAGVDMIDTALSSLSMGTSHYATECIIAALKDTPRDTGLNLHMVQEIDDYFKEIKKHYSEFESDFKNVDVKILESQIPGGMISNMENQLRDQGALDKLEEVLKEVPQVRQDMGYPPLVTPTSQIVGSQATLNVLTGERYKVITKETRECILGKYGKLPSTVNPELLEKLGGDKKMIQCRPADLLEPEWKGLVKECKKNAKVTTEEDLLSYAMFPKVALKFFETRDNPQPSVQKSTPAKTPAPAQPASAGQPVAAPIAQGTPSVFTVRVDGTPYTVEVITGGAAPVAIPQAPTQNTGETVTAKLPGSVFAIQCKAGDIVKENDTLIILESMKMEAEIKSHCDGKVDSICVQLGDNVKVGDPLVVLG